VRSARDDDRARLDLERLRIDCSEDAEAVEHCPHVGAGVDVYAGSARRGNGSGTGLRLR
jgi:hypothetical protein